jgi:hypothetical protein
MQGVFDQLTSFNSGIQARLNRSGVKKVLCAVADIHPTHIGASTDEGGLQARARAISGTRGLSSTIMMIMKKVKVTLINNQTQQLKLAQ